MVAYIVVVNTLLRRVNKILIQTTKHLKTTFLLSFYSGHALSNLNYLSFPFGATRMMTYHLQVFASMAA